LLRACDLTTDHFSNLPNQNEQQETSSTTS